MARFKDACAWIAYNDSDADGADEVLIRDYVTTALVADLFGVGTYEVAHQVARERERAEERRRAERFANPRPTR